jgi:EpsI family protein
MAVEPWVLDTAHSLRRRPALVLTLAALLLALGLVYRSTFQALAAEWSRSDTYSHGFLVPWIALALCWMRRDRIRATPLLPSLGLGGAMIALGLALKTLGFAAGATVVEASSLLPVLAGVLVCFGGMPLLRALLLPLLYLLFMIPVWAPLIDRLTPPFRHFSAWIGVHAATLVGVPAVIDGFHIDLPRARLLVAEACSGVNYLIAVTAVGIPLAWMTFPDVRRRVALLLLGTGIAILANGLRVSLIVILLYGGIIQDVHGPGHMLQGLSVAMVGYAGLFVGAWALARYAPSGSVRTRDLGPPRTLASSRPRSPWLQAGIAAAIALALAALALWQMRFHIHPVPLPRPLTTVPARIGAWHATEGALPALPVDPIRGSMLLERTYWDPNGAGLGVLAMYVEDQSGPHELVGFATSKVFRYGAKVTLRTASGRVLEARRSSEQDRNDEIVTLAWYDVGGVETSSPAVAKAATAWHALTGGHTEAAVVAVRARYPIGETSSREPDLRRFAGLFRDALAPVLHGGR